MMFEQSSAPFSYFVKPVYCLEAAIHDPSFVECRLGFRVFCAFAVFFKLALANRVDGAKGLHNSKRTDTQASLRFRNGLRSHSHATL